MAFIDIILKEPSYGWTNQDGELSKPTTRQLFKEALSRINILNTRKNWISIVTVVMVISLVAFLFTYLVYFFSWPLTGLLVLYSMVIMGVHATVWLHRYSTHKAFKFSHPIWRFITQNLVIKTVPEEIYVISHVVHHAKSDKPGDPYNARAGYWYCMLAEINHQRISSELSEKDYALAVRLISHTGIRVNSYKQYQKWGSITSPLYSIGLMLMNWILWYAILYFIGGHGLAIVIFSAALLWYVLVRAFNYTGHGKGNEKHSDMDFDRSNLSINQMRPGLLAGEWHNNHHLYPRSARSGFLKYQLDLAWVFIYVWYKLGLVSSYYDHKKNFLQKYASKTLATTPVQTDTSS